MWNDTAAQDWFAPFYTTKYAIVIWPSHYIPGYLSRKMKMDVHTKTRTWIFRATSLIIGPTWKQPNSPSGGEWLDKPEHPHHGLLLSGKEWRTDSSTSLDESRSLHWVKAKWKKPAPRGHILYDSIYTAFFSSLFLKCIFNWRIIGLQDWFDFCHTRYTHVPSLLSFPPISLPSPPF